jgi:hypothetical protein
VFGGAAPLTAAGAPALPRIALGIGCETGTIGAACWTLELGACVTVLVLLGVGVAWSVALQLISAAAGATDNPARSKVRNSRFIAAST